MIEVPINEPELLWIEMVRVALSEETVDARIRAIENVKFDAKASAAASLFDGKRKMNTDDPRYVASLLQMAKTSERSHDAAYEMAQTGQRYEDKNELRLNVAEQIGKLVCLSIADQKFAGLNTKIGIIQQVQYEARKLDMRGARDKDAVRRNWQTYKGVVHLGMAMDHLEDNSEDKTHVLHLAERFRRILSTNCPRGTTKPYVDPDVQIKFLYLSRL
jgi:hypothetical protein